MVYHGLRICDAQQQVSKAKRSLSAGYSDAWTRASRMLLWLGAIYRPVTLLISCSSRLNKISIIGIPIIN